MSSPVDWSDSNLRRRSFRGQNLKGANFCGADLRGCDFSDADLSEANLAQARIGVAPVSLIWGGLVLMGSGGLAFHMLSQLIFGILGMTATDPNYGLRLVLMLVLATVGLLVGLVASGVRTYHLLYLLAGFEGALVGFFVGGLVSKLDLNSAIRGGMVGTLLFCLGLWVAEAQGFGIVVATFGVVVANGMFFLAGVNTVQLLAAGHLSAMVWLIVALLYWLITLRAIGYLYREVKRMSVTSFAKANLSQVRWK